MRVYTAKPTTGRAFVEADLTSFLEFLAEDLEGADVGTVFQVGVREMDEQDYEALQESD